MFLGSDIMFEVMQEMFIQLIGWIPLLFGLWFLFDLIGALLFGRR